MMPRLVEYLDDQGRSPFGRWFQRLDHIAAAEVVFALSALERGNQGKVKSVGGGVAEYKVHFGPGYRVYFGRDGTDLLVLRGAVPSSDKQWISGQPGRAGNVTRNGDRG